jgi:3-hydroxypropanoate dehydrogenase
MNSFLDHALLEARTPRTWRSDPIDLSILKKAFEVAALGPTSANCEPLRVVFVVTAAAKKKLLPFMAPGNVEGVQKAPVTAIFAYDLAFYENLPELYPHTDAKSWFVGNDALIRETAFRNSSLQAAYLMLTFRSMGLDCGPMSGFDAKGVDGAFFTGTSWRSNFLCNLGHGETGDLQPRGLRLTFEQACQVL